MTTRLQTCLVILKEFLGYSITHLEDFSPLAVLTTPGDYGTWSNKRRLHANIVLNLKYILLILNLNISNDFFY